MHKLRWFDACWLLVCLTVSSAWCVTAARQLSATFDEPLYLERGLERWRSGSHAGLMKLGTMPLPVDWDTLPLYAYERWTGVPLDANRDLAGALPWARAAALVFWWLLLVYGWLTARAIAGPWAGRLAVAWLACEPNLLAHASLATTDVPISACLLALAYHFHAGREAGWWRRVGIPGVWFGAAVLAKASGIVFGPLCLLAIEGHRLWCGRSRRETTSNANFRSSFRDLMHIAAIGFAVTFLYCGCDWRAEPSFVAWAHALPTGKGHETMVWISEHLRIFSNAGEGLVRQIKHNMRGHHGSYLFGRAYDHPLWYYFPAALAVKLTLPLLAAPFVLPLARGRGFNWALAAALVLFAFSLNCRVQIGIRLMLPLVAFLVTGVAAALANLCGERALWRSVDSVEKSNCEEPPAPRGQAIWIAVAAASVLWTAVAAWRVWPEALCYTNELGGGTAHGYACLSDSNYDWGQGLKELADWCRRRQLTELDVWYFGTDPAVDQPPLRQLPLHILPITKPADVPLCVGGRYLAVSTTLAFGTGPDLPGVKPAVAYVRRHQPVARTSTFFIYDLGERPLARSVQKIER